MGQTNSKERQQQHHPSPNLLFIMTTTTIVSSLCVRMVLGITLWTLSVTTVAAAADVIDIPKWIVPYDGDQNITATVGDTLTLDWDATLYGPHNVYIHPTMDCELAGAIYVGETSPTSYVLTDQDGTPDGNPLFFSCDVGDGAHCNYGQWLIVTVFSDPDTATTASSADPPPNTATTMMPEAQEVVPASAGEEAVENLVEETAATASAGGGVVSSSSSSWCLATLGGITTLAALVVVAW